MTARYRSIFVTAIAAILLASAAFFIFQMLNNKTHVDGDEAIATDIDVAIQNSQVVVMGKVLDDGKGRNLRRDSKDPSKEDSEVVVPGTDYTVLVTKVLKGSVEPNSQIKVAVGGGDYKGKKSKLRASVKNDEEYLFTLATAGAGHPNYYGIIEPFIYQIKNNKVVAISNIEKYKVAFQETNITEEELFSKYKETK